MKRLMTQSHHRRVKYSPRGGFTLMELLVVMGIVAVLSAITAVAYRAVAKDSKMSSARNTIMAVLDNARGLAMRNNEIVLVAFRPRLDGNKQYVEAVLAKWTRQSIPYRTIGDAANNTIRAIDRYAPIPGITPRRLPTGIQISGPLYFDDLDDQWQALSYLPNINISGQGEVPGNILAVMFAPDGRNIMYNSKSDAQRLFVDFNNDGRQRWFQSDVNYTITPEMSFTVTSPLHDHLFNDDEPCVSPMPYLAVFDDENVRELYDISRWSVPTTSPVIAIANRENDYSDYLRNYADRIHFNRYTGVAMK